MSSTCFLRLSRLAGGLRLGCAGLAVAVAFGILVLLRPAYGLSPAGPASAGGDAARESAPSEPEVKKSAKKTTPKSSKKDPAGDPAEPEVKGKEGSTGGGSGSTSKKTKKPGEKGGTDGSGEYVPGGSEKGKVQTKKVLSIDEEYVKENLEKYLSPTKIEWKDDGSVRLVFNFGGKKEEHENIFTPPVSKEVNSNFRWSLRYEYGYSGRYVTDPDDKESDSYYYWDGLRIAMKGAAHLNLWLMDDVEVEIDYIQSVTSSKQQTVAVVFTNSAGNSLGSNFGTQCLTFSGGRPQKSSGDIETVPNEVGTKMKLVVKGGAFEAYRDGKKKSTMNYSPKSYSSGRVGFLWGGGIASFIHRLEIKGKVDAKKMAQILRKAKK